MTERKKIGLPARPQDDAQADGPGTRGYKPPVRGTAPRQRPTAAQAEHQFDVVAQAIGAGAVRLVHDEEVGDLQDAGLDGLHLIAQARRLDHDGGVRGAGDVYLRLADSHRFHQDAVEPGRVQHGDHVGSGVRQSAQAAARGHAADEDARIASQVAHAHPVPQQRTAGEGAGRVHGNDAHRLAHGPVGPGQRVDQGGFAGPRRTGHADNVRAAGVRVERGQQSVRLQPIILYVRDDPCQRAPVAGEQERDKGLICRLHGVFVRVGVGR